MVSTLSQLTVRIVHAYWLYSPSSWANWEHPFIKILAYLVDRMVILQRHRHYTTEIALLLTPTILWISTLSACSVPRVLSRIQCSATQGMCLAPADSSPFVGSDLDRVVPIDSYPCASWGVVNVWSWCSRRTGYSHPSPRLDKRPRISGQARERRNMLRDNELGDWESNS